MPWPARLKSRDPEMPADDMIVGDFSALKVYLGDGFRIDSSDVANDRWDKNLVGYRGELELAVDARPAVDAGARSSTWPTS